MGWLSDFICAWRGHPMDFDCGGNYFGCRCGRYGPCPSCGSTRIVDCEGIRNDDEEKICLSCARVF